MRPLGRSRRFGDDSNFIMFSSVSCGQCRAEKRPRPGVVGTLVELAYPAGTPARVIWLADDRRYAQDAALLLALLAGGKRAGRSWRDPVMLRDLGEPDLDAPERVIARCHYHGQVSVSVAYLLSHSDSMSNARPIVDMGEE